MNSCSAISKVVMLAVSLLFATVLRIGHTADQPSTSSPSDSAIDKRPRLDFEFSPLYTFGRPGAETRGIAGLVALRHSNFLFGVHADARANPYYVMYAATAVVGPSYLTRSGLRFDALVEAGIHHIGWIGSRGEPVASGPSANVATVGLRLGVAYQGRASTSGIVGLWAFARIDVRRDVEVAVPGSTSTESVAAGKTIVGIAGRFGTSFGL